MEVVRQGRGRKERWVRGERTGPTGLSLENSPLFLLTLARCLIASYFRIFRVELSIETRERGFVCVLSPTALVVYSLSLSPFFSSSPDRFVPFASLRPPHPTYPHQPLFPESVGCNPSYPYSGLFKTARLRKIMDVAQKDDLRLLLCPSGSLTPQPKNLTDRFLS